MTKIRANRAVFLMKMMESLNVGFESFEEGTFCTDIESLDLEFASLENFIEDIKTQQQTWDQSLGHGTHDLERKPTDKHASTTDKSYFALIALAIQSSPHGKMLLSEIYEWVQRNSLNVRTGDRSWRNSVRHTLSINECFIKAGLSETGKGNYWTIHPACLDSFKNNDFRRLNARCLVKKSEQMKQELQSNLERSTDLHVENSVCHDYVPMTLTCDTGLALAKIFGSQAIFAPEIMKAAKQISNTDYAMNFSNESNDVMQIDSEYEIDCFEDTTWMNFVF